jgi:hypothetical protein
MPLLSVGERSVRATQCEAEAHHHHTVCCGSYRLRIKDPQSKRKGQAPVRDGACIFFDGNARLDRVERTIEATVSHSHSNDRDWGASRASHRGCGVVSHKKADRYYPRMTSKQFASSSPQRCAQPGARFGSGTCGSPSGLKMHPLVCTATTPGSRGSASASSSASERTGVTGPSLSGRHSSIFRPFQLQASGHALMVISALDGPPSNFRDDTDADAAPVYVETEQTNRHTVTIFYSTGWSRPMLHYTTNLEYGTRVSIPVGGSLNALPFELASYLHPTAYNILHSRSFCKRYETPRPTECNTTRHTKNTYARIHPHGG